jgi:hypothetical protein
MDRDPEPPVGGTGDLLSHVSRGGMVHIAYRLTVCEPQFGLRFRSDRRDDGEWCTTGPVWAVRPNLCPFPWVSLGLASEAQHAKHRA